MTTPASARLNRLRGMMIPMEGQQKSLTEREFTSRAADDGNAKNGESREGCQNGSNEL